MPAQQPTTRDDALRAGVGGDRSCPSRADRAVPALLVTALVAVCLLAGCDADAEPPAPAAPARSGPQPSAGTPVEQSIAPAPTLPARPSLGPDRRWRFFTDDRTRYGSPWFPGRHRVMIDYGCTEAPYYVADPRCDGQGFHHGVDVALPCGTPLFAGVGGRVVSPEPGTVGPAYGERPLLLRTTVDGRPADVLVGHARELLVQPGQRVRRGEPIAITGSSAAPDGCHLHLEVRSPGGDVTTARDPSAVLGLR